MKYLSIILLLIPVLAWGQEYSISAVETIPHHKYQRLDLPSEDCDVKAFMIANLNRIKSIEDADLNSIKQAGIEFVSLLDELSGIDLKLPQQDRLTGYCWSPPNNKISKEKIAEAENWLDIYGDLLTVDLIYEAYSLASSGGLPPQYLKDRLRQRVNSRKEFSDSTGVDVKMLCDDENGYRHNIFLIQRAFGNQHVNSICPGPYDMTLISRLLSKMNDMEKINVGDYRILTRERLAEIEEWMFRNHDKVKELTLPKMNDIDYKTCQRIYDQAL